MQLGRVFQRTTAGWVARNMRAGCIDECGAAAHFGHTIYSMREEVLSDCTTRYMPDAVVQLDKILSLAHTSSSGVMDILVSHTATLGIEVFCSVQQMSGF